MGSTVTFSGVTGAVHQCFYRDGGLLVPIYADVCSITLFSTGRRGGVGRRSIGLSRQTAMLLRWGMAAVLVLAALFKHGAAPSRRLVNGSYIALVVALNLSCLLAIWLAMRTANHGGGNGAGK